ncbi:MAG TPA: hypothetical protein VLA61_24490 [Ideonella sp.]|uniref:hypothetical protein n=1 Tax=Ideonella sp. TaxID=1929293 RepID=UPI002C1C4655|nr:hypothetical protein [Ideonella sp.]HSI51439.1 hypothetical protein [Ideonella sp.]
MNIEIDQLNLQLPSGFEQRAPRIARLLAEALQQQLGGLLQPAGGAAPSVPTPAPIAELRVSPATVQPRHSDRTIALQLAGQVAQAIHRQQPHPAAGS